MDFTENARCSVRRKAMNIYSDMSYFGQKTQLNVKLTLGCSIISALIIMLSTNTDDQTIT